MMNDVNCKIVDILLLKFLNESKLQYQSILILKYFLSSSPYLNRVQGTRAVCRNHLRVSYPTRLAYVLSPTKSTSLQKILLL